MQVRLISGKDSQKAFCNTVRSSHKTVLYETSTGGKTSMQKVACWLFSNRYKDKPDFKELYNRTKIWSLTKADFFEILCRKPISRWPGFYFVDAGGFCGVFKLENKIRCVVMDHELKNLLCVNARQLTKLD